ncbi:uncharacterized protein LOC125058541 [Pieris napi]|uniref:uncharacterized protein LOC125048846 n=1 Tax=Pieris napi TaxID=78633 RepID=UPI001FB89CB1|nr:uncharacterized protein LOC125048846 [Pieris napi]XP_047518433.1 uncharacterized protein LOC125058396 [Pieris napi]XP_047518489.1 uncharacterized protein LOC125058458 [Pieris napi]XP_047518589.1 uncharacterized protein LOC125058541 [Pieris napi]
MANFDTERFIIEVENRRGLWDLASNDYSNKDVKRQLWLEVVDIFGGESMEDKEKAELGITLQKRWKNLRDCFTRELRRLKDVKSGSAAKRKSQYTYFNQLLFLKSVLDTNATENSLEEASQENESARSSDLETQQSASKSLRTKRKKKIPNEESDTDPLISVLHKTIATTQNDSNCDRLFLLSLLERFQTIPAAMKTKAKMEIMEIIEKYQPNYSGYSTTNRISDDSNYSDTHTHYSDISQNSEMIDLFPNLND